MYSSILEISGWVFISLLIISVVLLSQKIIYHIYGLFPAKKFPDAKKEHKFAILIPARNESNVISNLLNSLKEQDYPKDLFDVYVIVESKDDPTCKICSQYDAICFVRPDLSIKTKGGALDQIVKHLLNSGIAQKKGYEAYFIFDADNTLEKDFLTEMNKSFDAGFEMALGYRNSKDWNKGWVASCSALTFSMVNTFQNKCRARLTKNVLVSGTGFYVSANIINKLQGWPFFCLTEDAEISNYAVLHNIKATYNEFAEFYDNQPTKLKPSWNQRLRWIKGFMQVSKKYHRPLVKSVLFSRENKICKIEFAFGLIPVAVPLASVICYILFTFILGIVGVSIGVSAELWTKAFCNCAISLAGIYLFFFAYTAVLLFAERKHLDITFKNAVITCFMNPIFLASYMPLFFEALFKKSVAWKPIEHTKS